MDIGSAFTFAFNDKDWLKKLGIGALYTLACFFIIPIPILIGYQLATMRNTLNGVKDPLPSWDDAGGLFSDGLKFIGVALAYAAPVIILYICGAVGIVAASEAGGAEELAGVIIVIMQCVGLLYSILLALIMPGAALRYIEYGTIGACFEFNEILAYTRRNIGNLLLAWVAIIAASILLQIVVVVASFTICGGIIIALAGAPWTMAVRGNLYAQVALNDDQRGKSDKEAFFDDYSY